MRNSSGTCSSLLAHHGLPAEGVSPELELIEVNGEFKGSVPVLCIHGAFAGAWMWEPFLHELGRRGVRAIALSVRGHGKSRGLLRGAHLEDYIADVRRAIARLDAPPFIIGHSLGAFLAQRLIGRVPMRGLAMLTPIPPEGMCFLLPRILANEPMLLLQLVQSPRLESFVESGTAVRRLKRLAFSERSSADDMRRHLSQMVLEPLSVLLEAQLPFPALAAWLLGIPALVISAHLDNLVPSDVAIRTALYHGAEHVSIREHGHMLLVEGGAAEVADVVCRWLPRTQATRRWRD